MPQPQLAPDAEHADPGSDRDTYFRALIRELTDALTDVLGPDDASAFITLAAQRLAARMIPDGALNGETLAPALVELKGKLGGDFHILSQTPEQIMLGNRACPFGSLVAGKTVLCMFTSTILGCVSSRQPGYARVQLHKTIAQGDPECLISVHLTPPENSAQIHEGREYFSHQPA